MLIADDVNGILDTFAHSTAIASFIRTRVWKRVVMGVELGISNGELQVKELRQLPGWHPAEQLLEFQSKKVRLLTTQSWHLVLSSRIHELCPRATRRPPRLDC